MDKSLAAAGCNQGSNWCQSGPWRTCLARWSARLMSSISSFRMVCCLCSTVLKAIGIPPNQFEIVMLHTKIVFHDYYMGNLQAKSWRGSLTNSCQHCEQCTGFSVKQCLAILGVNIQPRQATRFQRIPLRTMLFWLLPRNWFEIIVTKKKLNATNISKSRLLP